MKFFSKNLLNYNLNVLRIIKNILLNIVIFFVTICILFLIFELTLRMFFQIDITPSIARKPGDNGFGYRPNAEGTYITNEFKAHFKINSKGIRGPEIAYGRKKSEKRILGLGDSMVWGYGLNQNETFTARLKKILVDSGYTNYECINFGFQGLNPLQELRAFISEGIKYSPDIVVWVVYIGNDFNGLESVDLTDGNYIESTKIRENENTSYIRYLVHYVPGYIWLIQHSHFINFISKRVQDYFTLQSFKKNNISASDLSRLSKKRIAVFAQIVHNLNEFLNAYKIKLLVVLIPSKEPGKNNYYTSAREVMNNQNISYLDMVPFCFKNVNKYYFKSDIHLNPAGSNLMAIQTYKKLRSLHILDDF